MPLYQLPHRDAHRLLDVAGRLDVAGNAEDLGTGVARTADGGKPRGAPLQDGRRGRDRFDVVDCRRTTIEADGRREGWLQARLALLALEAFEQSRLLAAD